MNRTKFLPLLVFIFLFSGCCTLSQPEEPPELVDIQPGKTGDFFVQHEALPDDIPLHGEPTQEEPHSGEPQGCPEGFEELEEYGCNFAQPNEVVSSRGMLINLSFLKEKNCSFDFMNWTEFSGYFLVFNVEAENNGTQKEYLAPSHFTLFDSEGKKRTASDFDVLYCANRNDLVLQSYLLPNQSGSGQLWFEVSGRNISGQLYVAYDRNGVEGDELIFPFRLE
jgi:hypothetical protein